MKGKASTIKNSSIKRPTVVSANPRRQRPVEVRARILEAAFSLFSTYGFEGTSTRAVASDAHVSISLLIYHFKSKDALWKDVIQDVFNKHPISETIKTVCAEKLSAKAKLERIIERSVHRCAEVPALHRLMTMEGHQVSDRLLWLCDKFVKQDFKDLCALIAEGQSDGTVRSMNPARLRYAMIAVAAVPFSVSAEYQYLTKHNPFAAAEIAHTIDLIKHLVFVDP